MKSIQATLPPWPWPTAASMGPLAAAPDSNLPTWSDFQRYVMLHGDKYARASYPDAPFPVINTIWAGIPVIEHEQARVMTPAGEWLAY